MEAQAQDYWHRLHNVPSLKLPIVEQPSRAYCVDFSGERRSRERDSIREGGGTETRADHNVADEPETAALHEVTRQPAGYGADD